MPVSVNSGGSKSGSTKTASQKTSPGIPIVVGAIVLLLLFVGWMAYKNLKVGGPPIQAGPTQESKNDWLAQDAKKVGGDFSKLDPAEQRKLDIYTGGHGAELVKHKYETATH